MVKKFIQCQIICDICKVNGCKDDGLIWGYKYTNYKIPQYSENPREMRQLAKEYGWIYENKKDIYPKCQKKDRLK